MMMRKYCTFGVIDVGSQKEECRSGSIFRDGERGLKSCEAAENREDETESDHKSSKLLFPLPPINLCDWSRGNSLTF